MNRHLVTVGDYLARPRKSLDASRHPGRKERGSLRLNEIAGGLWSQDLEQRRQEDHDGLEVAVGSSMITQAQPFPRTVVAGVDQVGHELRSVDTALLPQTLSSLPDGGSGLGTTKICLGSFSNCGVRSLEGNCAVSGATRYYCSVTSLHWLHCSLLLGFTRASSALCAGCSHRRRRRAVP